MLRKFIHRLGVDIIFKSLTFLIAIFIGGYSIKVLGLTQLGFVQIIQVSFLFFQCLLGFNIFNNAIVNFTAAAPKCGSVKDFSSIANTCNLALLSYSLLFVIPAFIFFENNTLNHINIFYCILLVVSAQVLNSASQIYLSLMTGKGDLVYVGVSDGILSLLNSSAVFAAIYFCGNIIGYLSAIVSIAFIRFIFYLMSCIFYGYYTLAAPVGITSLKRMPLFCKSAYIASLTQLFNTCADTILVAFFGGISAVPVYTMAQNILFGIHSLICSTSGSVFSILSGKGELAIATISEIRYKLFWGISRLSLFLYGLASVFVPILMGEIVSHEFGRDLSLFMFFASMMGIGMMFAAYAGAPLMVMKKMKTIAVLDWVTTCSVFFLSVLLGYIFFSKGIALARTFYFFTGIIYIYCLNRALKLEWRKLYELAPIFVSCTFIGFLTCLNFIFIGNALYCISLIIAFILFQTAFFYYDFLAGNVLPMIDILKRIGITFDNNKTLRIK